MQGHGTVVTYHGGYRVIIVPRRCKQLTVEIKGVAQTNRIVQHRMPVCIYCDINHGVKDTSVLVNQSERVGYDGVVGQRVRRRDDIDRIVDRRDPQGIKKCLRYRNIVVAVESFRHP